MSQRQTHQPDVRERAGSCPSCDHRAGKPMRWDPVTWLLNRITGRGPLPASCGESDGGMNASGWPSACGCTDPFHGS